ncbi:MAG: hypothetical protein RLZZ592_1249 [Pseudomonadota bacterium]|jgi:hypothetical protein|nr:hypothetical protein [Pseudomonadota bacterium]
MAQILVPVQSQAFAAAEAPLVRLVGWLADQWRAMQARMVDGLTVREPRTPEELIEWAGRYEATQPSYAADLRAAAVRAQKVAGSRYI